MWTALREFFAQLWTDESGHHFMEYAILPAVISMAIFTALQATAANLKASYEVLSNSFQ